MKRIGLSGATIESIGGGREGRKGQGPSLVLRRRPRRRPPPASRARTTTTNPRSLILSLITHPHRGPLQAVDPERPPGFYGPPFRVESRPIGPFVRDRRESP